MATSRIVTTLLAQLAVADGATRTLRVLAGAELDKDNAIYAAHLAAADELVAVLRGLTWQLLDDFAAGDDDQDAAAILAELRQAARHEELEVSLAGPLREAERAALELVRTRTRKPLRIDRPSGQEPGPRLDHAIGQRPGAEPGPREARFLAGHPRPRAGRAGPGEDHLRGGRRQPGGRVRDQLADRDVMIATRSVVEAEFGRALRSRHSNKRNSVLLLRAAPEWRGDREFSVTIEGDQVPVTVAPCPTVLAVLDAMGAAREDGRYLVVLTPCDSRDVGDSVLARAMQPEIKPINRWDLVADAFGARGLDPALTRSDRRWVAEALLDAQPPGGWRRLAGPVLTEAAALNRLAATRLGIEDADGSAVDAAALLQWTTHPDAVASFLQLRETERDGLVQWLDQTAAPVAGIVFAMAGPGKLTDAVPFGLAIAALYSDEHPAPDTLTARIRAEERYLGGHSPGPAALVAFGVAAESLVARWTDNGRAPQAAEQCERAEAILRDLAGSREMVLVLAGHSRVLEAGLDARLGALGDAISAALANPVGETLAAAAKALDQVYEHGRIRDRTAEIRTAEAALRLTRWLASAEEPPTSLDEAATRMLRSWAWADRALVGLSRADTSRVPGLGAVYASLWDQAKARRARLDQAFARKLAAWTQGSSDPDGLLLVENVLDRVVRPLARQRPPVVVVLDGMTAAAGCEIAEELTADGTWLEAGRRPDGREPVLATVPSVTAVSRTSLLTGTLRSGGQAEERSGFAEFWGRRTSALFHKADLEPEPADCLGPAVRKSIADPDTVVGVVLNTIDDTLAKDRPGGPRHWTVADVTYLGADPRRGAARGPPGHPHRRPWPRPR